MSCDWPWLPKTAPRRVAIMSFVDLADFLIKSVMPAVAWPVTSLASLKRVSVNDRSLSVVQSCLRLRREFAGEGEHTRGCGTGTLHGGVARDSSDDCCRSTENGEDVEGLVRLAVGKLQDLLDCADAERILDETEDHLGAQGPHVAVEVLHGKEKVVETALVNCIEVICSAG
jgi:hypothetical protein